MARRLWSRQGGEKMANWCLKIKSFYAAEETISTTNTPQLPGNYLNLHSARDERDQVSSHTQFHIEISCSQKPPLNLNHDH